jgi:putative OPT family oligopeptide transporter
MMHDETPYISADASIAELTFRGILLAIVLTMVLAISNAYLALKLGILTSASIPAAMISIGILRLFKGSTVLENNAVQTAASAGEAVAGGIVYTIPGLVVIGYWHSFDYLTNFLIALTGGVLGVLFSIPLRRILVNDRALQFPEGRAIAEVLKTSVERRGLRDLAYGGLIGSALELFQMGFNLIASTWSYWFMVSRSLFSLGAGFSATMVGAGFLVGHDMALSIFIGAIVAWLIALPVASQFYPDWVMQALPQQAGMHLWNSELRYLGIGAMLFAGLWTFAKLFKPLMNRVYMTLVTASQNRASRIIRTDMDIPMPYLFMGVLLMSAVLFGLFQGIFPFDLLHLPDNFSLAMVFLCVCYVLLIGFLFAVITAYFSGMVGVSASPGSSIVIAGVLLAAYLLLRLLQYVLPLPLSSTQIQAAEAVTIIIGSVVTGIAAIANDNTQDLKVGQLVGATPWKQQVMLLLGVLVSALVIPLVMQLLFNVYGIAGVMPHEGMDVNQSLPAPTAALLAAVADGVFQGALPWKMMGIGSAIIGLFIIFNHVTQLQRRIKLSMLGIAIGMYLPVTTTFPLFIGGMIALWVQRHLQQQVADADARRRRMQPGILIACGLVAGSALMDVLLAFIFSVGHGPDSLRLVGDNWQTVGTALGFASLVMLALWIKHRVCQATS